MLFILLFLAKVVQLEAPVECPENNKNRFLTSCDTQGKNLSKIIYNKNKFQANCKSGRLKGGSPSAGRIHQEFSKFYDEWHFYFEVKIPKTESVPTNLFFLSNKAKDDTSGALGEIFSISVVGDSSILSFCWDAKKVKF